MAWSAVDELLYSEGEDPRYKFLVLPSGGPQVAWAVSLETTGVITVPRRRTGFIVPFVGIDGRQLLGPSEAVFRNLDGQPLSLHIVGYGWLQQYPGLTARVQGYGVGCVPERGAYPSVLTLWGLI